MPPASLPSILRRKRDTDLVQVVNKQNEYLKSVAQHGGYASEFNYINNEFNVRKTMENAMDEYLRKKNCGIASQFFSLQVM